MKKTSSKTNISNSKPKHVVFKKNPLRQADAGGGEKDKDNTLSHTHEAGKKTDISVPKVLTQLDISEHSTNRKQIGITKRKITKQIPSTKESNTLSPTRISLEQSKISTRISDINVNQGTRIPYFPPSPPPNFPVSISNKQPHDMQPSCNPPIPMKITDDELRNELLHETPILQIAAKYGVTHQGLYKRIRRMKQDDADLFLTKHTAEGIPILDMRSQLLFLNRITWDILRDTKTPANTKLTAIKRVEAQNELQARLEQILVSIQNTTAFQQAVITVISELETAYPGIKLMFMQKMREQKTLVAVTTPTK